MEWISVKDRLPEKDYLCLVTVKPCSEDAPSFVFGSAARYKAYVYKPIWEAWNEEGVPVVFGEGMWTGMVTHWMKWPEPAED